MGAVRARFSAFRGAAFALVRHARVWTVVRDDRRRAFEKDEPAAGWAGRHGSRGSGTVGRCLRACRKA